MLACQCPRKQLRGNRALHTILFHTILGWFSFKEQILETRRWMIGLQIRIYIWCIHAKNEYVCIYIYIYRYTISYVMYVLFAMLFFVFFTLQDLGYRICPGSFYPNFQTGYRQLPTIWGFVPFSGPLVPLHAKEATNGTCKKGTLWHVSVAHTWETLYGDGSDDLNLGCIAQFKTIFPWRIRMYAILIYIYIY